MSVRIGLLFSRSVFVSLKRDRFAMLVVIQYGESQQHECSLTVSYEEIDMSASPVAIECV